MNAITSTPSLALGSFITVQLGNPSDTSWAANAPAIVIAKEDNPLCESYIAVAKRPSGAIDYLFCVTLNMNHGEPDSTYGQYLCLSSLIDSQLERHKGKEADTIRAAFQQYATNYKNMYAYTELAKNEYPATGAFATKPVPAPMPAAEVPAKKEMSLAAKMRAECFNTFFNRITNELPYNPDWANGTGYYDGAVREGTDSYVNLEPGTYAKSVAAGENKRRMIFVGTALGTIVVFQRFTDDDSVYVTNATRRLERARIPYINDGAVSEAAMNFILGESYLNIDDAVNIGRWIDRLISSVVQFK